MAKKGGWQEVDKLTNNPFAALRKEGDIVSAPSSIPEKDISKAPLQRKDLKRGQYSARLERKGRGGKEVTLITVKGWSSEDYQLWLSWAKKRLGIGGAVEGDCIVLQGDQRERLEGLTAS